MCCTYKYTYNRHSIDSITLKAVSTAADTSIIGRRNSYNNGYKSSSFETTATDVLRLVRTLSNLEEDLHHSVFYYFTIGHHSFVSFGEYAYALALLLVPVAVEVFSIIQVSMYTSNSAHIHTYACIYMYTLETIYVTCIIKLAYCMI
jgi:Gaa1-like, GPI transamidase component